MSLAGVAPETVPPAQAGSAPQGTLRRKGVLLFVLVSAYVVAGGGALAWYALQPLASGSWAGGRAGTLLGLAAVAVILGLVVFGSFLTRFLGRLAADLGSVQARAVQVARGEAGAPLALDRDDEVGTLARAIESMAADLEARQAHIAAARLEQFHNERMMLLGGVAAGVAHEIGNPVASIAAIATEVAAAHREGRAPAADPQQLVAHCERLAEVTRRLSLVAGQRSKERAPIDLNELVRGVTALVALDARFRHVAIETCLDPELPVLHVAQDDLLQLLLHLLTNAAEALVDPAPAAPVIWVSTRRDGAQASLGVEDNGRGMSPETRARAFEPFFTTKPAGRGNGLGLEACRKIAQLYGGSVSLESTPGKGTRVLCTLPSAPAEEGALL